MSAFEMNAHGQPVGLPVSDCAPRPVPPHIPLQGRFGQVLPLQPGHAAALFTAFQADRDGRDWTYLPIEAWSDLASAQAWCDQSAASRDPLFYTILDPQGTPLGFCSYLRITPAAASIEVGYIHLSRALQRTPLASEAMFLMMCHVFDDLGYRRFEWKCDALNAPSRSAAKRLGFAYEGIFRQATIVKGRNRDTAWFAMTDGDWPRIKSGFAHWLDPANFDGAGQQIRRLDIRQAAQGPGPATQ